MKIYKEYTTDELVMDLPCHIDNLGKIFPVKVKEYKKFLNYAKYLVYGRKHLKLDEDTFLLQGIYHLNIAIYQSEGLEQIEAIGKVLTDMEDLFSILTRKKIYVKVEKGEIKFTDVDFTEELKKQKLNILKNEKTEMKKPTIIIDNKNFDILRKVILKMVLLREPKIYEREIDRKWEEKALAAKKGKSIELGEILTIIRIATGDSYEYLTNLNIFQLYCDYYRLQQVDSHDKTSLFATVSDKVKVDSFVENIVDVLYKDPTEDLNVKGDFEKMIQ